MKGYVQVYRNLNKKLHDGDHGPVYSVRGDDGLVKRHTCHLVIHDCTFLNFLAKWIKFSHICDVNSELLRHVIKYVLYSTNKLS